MQHALLTANDRIALRRRVRLACQVVSEQDHTLLSTLCLDLSPRSMSARLEAQECELYTRVRVSFRVPETGVHMDLAAEVTRINFGRRRADRYAVLGLRFLDLTLIDGILLAARLHGLPPPPPARRLRMDYAGSVQAVYATLERNQQTRAHV